MIEENPLSLHDYLERQGRNVLESYTCPVTGIEGPAFSFIVVDLEGAINWYISSVEYLDRQARIAREEAEATAQSALLDDWSYVRATRNNLLLQSDWTQGKDAERRGLTPTEIAAWADYRQELADITETYSNPSEVMWPTPPQ